MFEHEASHARQRRGGTALLVAFATAVAGFLPAAFAYDTVSRWLSPMRHAEEAMGRGLEVLLIGAPAGALTLAAIVGWLAYRQGTRRMLRALWAIVGVCVVASLLLTQVKALL